MLLKNYLKGGVQMTKLGEKQIAWTKDEVESFKKDWVTMKKPDILKKYNRTYQALKTAARKHKVKRGFSLNKYRLKKLLEETNINYYWLGFIVSDGSINNTTLRITLSNIDLNHLIKFSEYMDANIKIGDKYSLVAISDNFYNKKIQEKFSLHANKTYTGADFNIENHNHFFSFLAGLIDGDGCFCMGEKKVNMIRIHCHSSYFEFYKKISERLKEYGIESRVYMCSRGYCKFVISRQKYFIKLNEYVRDCNIPLLERKWGKLDNIINA